MKNTILKQVNDVGAKLGYPFYIYSDGTCGKSIVSGKMNAAIMVKKKFPVKELKSEFLNCSAENEEDVLAHLSQIGDNIGFPFYVYANGTCGTTARSQTDNLPFVMFIKEPFQIEQLVLDPELLQTIQAKEKPYQSSSTTSSCGITVSAKISASSVPTKKLSPRELVSQMGTWSDDVIKVYFEKYWLYQEVQKLMFEMHCDGNYELSETAEQLMIEKCSDDVIKAYFKKHSLFRASEKLMIEKCSDDVIKAYFEKHSLWPETEKLMFEIRSDDVNKAYVGKYKFTETTEQLMIEKCSDDVIKAYIKTSCLTEAAEKLVLEKCSDDIIKAYIGKYELFDDAQCLMIEKYRDDIIKAYIGKYSLCDEAQERMIEKCSDDVVMTYIEKYQLCNMAQRAMVKKCSDDMVKTYRQKYSISVSTWGAMRKRYGFFWFWRV